jgi:hypothetical protein
MSLFNPSLGDYQEQCISCDTAAWKSGPSVYLFLVCPPQIFSLSSFVSGPCGNFSLHHRVQTDSVAHPASYPLGARGSFFPGSKAAGA